MNKEQLYNTIKRTIQDNRFGVEKALEMSNVSIPNGASNDKLFKIIITEITNKGNGYLVFHLENVINTDIQKKKIQEHSNIAPAVIGVVSLLPSLFGKKGGGTSQAQSNLMVSQQATQQIGMQYEMAKMQSVAKAQERRENALREERADIRRKNMIIFGSIIGVVLLGVGGWYVWKVRKNKA
ncbi:MAG: hypothetical protein ACW98D_16680 [Promethearchaeota archaeon]|jgi:hypothetical protein